MRVLVTGGAGFIGRHVVDHLRYVGAEPVVLDRPHNVLSHWDVAELGEGCNAVIHLAGALGTAELFDNFDYAVDTNVKGTQRVLEFCRETGAHYVGITMPDVWANVYQATKQCAKTLATAYHESFGVPVSHVRAFNAFGVGQAYGPGHPQKIIPTFASLAWRGEDIPVWGDGTQTVDLVSATDLAKVLVNVLHYGDNRVYDGGSGVEWSVWKTAEFVNRYCGGKSKIIHLPMRDGERPHTHLCATGENWSRLRERPFLKLEELVAAIESYQPPA